MKRTIGALAGFLAVGALAIPGGASASDDDEIRNAGQCTGGTSSEIKVKPDDGRLEVEFEVDQNQTGDRWKVKLKDNGDVVFKGSAVTGGRSGSFSIEKKIPNRSGTDTIRGTARNTDGGERCAAKVSI
jgi:hypothetical protein